MDVEGIQLGFEFNWRHATLVGAIFGLMHLYAEEAKASRNQSTVSVASIQSTSTNAGEKSSNSFSGNVSWYGPQFHGKKTASGEIFDMYKPTAAHLTLPFYTKVLVEDPCTGKTAIVKVNDRGPYVRGRVMDLSREGARRLGTLMKGVTFVDCLVIGPAG